MADTQAAYGDITSPFIACRLRETDWPHHEYIDDLLLLQHFLTNGGPTSFAEAMIYHHVQTKYPAEFRALCIEYRENRAITDEEYLLIREEIHCETHTEKAQRLLQERREKRGRQQVERSDYAAWRNAGGQP